MKTIKDLFASKKFVVMLAAIVVYAAGRVGWDMKSEDAVAFITMVSSYLVGQGIADHGKEKAKLEAGK